MQQLSLQFSKMSMDPRNQRQSLPPPPSINFFIIQQPLELQANTVPRREGFYGLPFCNDPVVYQGMAQLHQYQYRAPSSGPRRNQRRKGFREAEAHGLFNILHEPSGTNAEDRSTGIHPGYAQIGANDNSGAEKMVTKPYNRNRSSRTRRRRTDNVGPSAYEIPIVESKGGAKEGNPNIATARPMLSTWTTAPESSAPESSGSTSTAYTGTTRNKKAQKQPVEEDDFDTISLGSDTD